jgi:hypothetical protein
MQYLAILFCPTSGFRPILRQKSVSKKKTRIGCFHRLRTKFTVLTLYFNVRPFPQKKTEVLWPLLTSVALCSGTRSYLASDCHRSPRVRTQTFIPCTCRIYHHALRAAVGFCFVLQTHPRIMALYAISVRQVGTLPPTSFRFRLTTDTLVFG